MLEERLMTIFYAVVIGVGATIVMDIWSVLLKIFFAIPRFNFALVGRWLGHMASGKLIHNNIKNSAPVKGEAAIGWMAHYLIGISFAMILLMVRGLEWVWQPTLLPALMVGIATVILPLLIMQPCFGVGIVSSKLPRPNSARLKSLLTHTVFGAGLYISALLLMLFQSS